MNRTRLCRCPGSEPLEARRLLSAAVADGTLRVVGTNAADAIVVYASPPQAPGDYVVVISAPNNANRQEFRFPVAGVSAVSVRGLAGDDTIRLDALNERGQDVRVPSRIDGGLGNDTLVGTVARDFITGGFGNDLIVAKDGDDWVDGGWGLDDVRGGNGNDYVYGNYGDDAVYGEAGNDRISGGPGDDRLGFPGFAGDPAKVQEPGDDLLLGGSGEDWLTGGEGRDRVFGSSGRDHFSPLDAEPAEVRDRTAGEPDDVPTPDGRGYLTFAFRGTVTHVSTPSGGRTDGVRWPAVGTEFRGTYTFDPLAVNTGMGSGRTGVYATAPHGPVVVEVGEYRWAAPSSYVTTYDLPGGDLYEAGDWIPSMELVSHPDVAAVFPDWNFQLNIEGDPALLGSFRLPMVPPSLEHARSATLRLANNGLGPGPDVAIVATLESLTLVPTPPGD